MDDYLINEEDQEVDEATEMEINGIVLTLDLLDPDTIDKYTDFQRKLVKTSDSSDQSEGDKLREMVKLIDEMFDSLYGDGTSRKLFGDEKSLRPRIPAMMKLVDLANRQSNSVQDFMGQYAPTRLNRAQRRKR